jgi:hypothetical protein
LIWRLKQALEFPHCWVNPALALFHLILVNACVEKEREQLRNLETAQPFPFDFPTALLVETNSCGHIRKPVRDFAYLFHLAKAFFARTKSL